MTSKPKVFGVGLSKAGTKSLQQALVFFGYSNRSWDPELHVAWHTGKIGIDAIFAVTDAYDCVEAWPYLAVFSQLMDRYGSSARYILTLRKSDSIWLDSVIAHADRVGPDFDLHRRLAFGYEHPRGHEQEYLARYHRHNEEVKEAVSKRNLQSCFKELCWETGDGWNELCRLIGQTPPDEPFPHSNRRPA